MPKRSKLIDPKTEAELCRTCPYRDCTYGPNCPLRTHLEGNKKRIESVGSAWDSLFRTHASDEGAPVIWKAWTI